MIARLSFLVATAALLALAGCSDLGAVQSVSSRLSDASDSWHDVAGEFRQSCGRARQFNPAIADCAAPAAAGQAIGAIDAILGAYFQALTDTASDRNFTVAPGLGALGASAERIPGIDSAQVEAATGLASLLARIATDAARERSLRELIGTGAPLAHDLIGALRHAVPPALATSLAAERDTIGLQFALYIQTGGAASIPIRRPCAPAARFRTGSAAPIFCWRSNIAGGSR